MKCNLGVFILLVCVLTPAVYLFSQDTEGTVEEFYLQSMEMQIISEQAGTLDRDMKLMALDNIESMLDDGKIGEGDPEVHYILNSLVNEGVGHQVRENNRLINDFPVVRKEACALMGKLGGENAKTSLITILGQDAEPMVLSEAVYQLGVLGFNRNNEVSSAIAQAVQSQNAINPSDNFAYASLLAFQKLAKANGGLQDPYAFRAIIMIAQGPYIWEVRVKANEVLSELRSY